MYLPGAFKILIMSFLIICYFSTASLLWLLIKNKILQKKMLVTTINLYCKTILRILNIEVSINLHSINNDVSSPFLYVSNHLSYLDVLILFAYFPSCFITSREVKETPFLGLITTLAGCIFVERRSKNKIEDEIKEIEDTLKNKFSVFVFPEATSTNGEAIKKFKRPLFNAAITTQTSVLPLTINYLQINNQIINQQNKDLVLWYGDMTFFNHFFRLMFIKSIKVNIVISDKIKPIGHDKTSLALLANTIVEQSFIPIQ